MFKKKSKVVKQKIVNPGQVIISAGHPSPPAPHEVSTAWILAHHYHTTALSIYISEYGG